MNFMKPTEVSAAQSRVLRHHDSPTFASMLSEVVGIIRFHRNDLKVGLRLLGCTYGSSVGVLPSCPEACSSHFDSFYTGKMVQECTISGTSCNVSVSPRGGL